MRHGNEVAMEDLFAEEFNLEQMEAETEAAVEMMVVRHLSHVMRRSRFSRLRLTA